MTTKRLRVLTWHVHGNYLYYLTQTPCDFYLVTDEARSVHHTGRSGSLPWGPNVHEVRSEAVRTQQFDVVLYQSRQAWDTDRLTVLSPAQLRLPQVYLEHDPPLESPTDQRHWVDDPDALLVHVTHHNALMWDSGRTPTRVIEHGVKLLGDARYSGHRPAGLVAINDIDTRGRRMGFDLYREAAAKVPLELVGMGTLRCGGEGEIANAALPGRIAANRFMFSPIRNTSLGLTFIEAMMIGCPVVGLATNELASVISNGMNGVVDSRLEVLIETMNVLIKHPALAVEMGAAARRMAAERFAIGRFTSDWLTTLQSACA